MHLVHRLGFSESLILAYSLQWRRESETAGVSAVAGERWLRWLSSVCHPRSVLHPSMSYSLQEGSLTPVYVSPTLPCWLVFSWIWPIEVTYKTLKVRWGTAYLGFFPLYLWQELELSKFSVPKSNSQLGLHRHRLLFISLAPSLSSGCFIILFCSFHSTHSSVSSLFIKVSCERSGFNSMFVWNTGSWEPESKDLEGIRWECSRTDLT